MLNRVFDDIIKISPFQSFLSFIFGIKQKLLKKNAPFISYACTSSTHMCALTICVVHTFLTVLFVPVCVSDLCLFTLFLCRICSYFIRHKNIARKKQTKYTKPMCVNILSRMELIALSMIFKTIITIE